MLISYGHGADSIEKTLETLGSAGVTSLVDVRKGPGSRRNPQFMRGAMEEWLPEAGIRYRWDKRLGGFRPPVKDSPDVCWDNDSFRNYASHMRAEEFLTGLSDLIDEADAWQTAFMCSEPVWWRCHRRLIADFLQVAREIPVMHLMHDHRLVPHNPYGKGKSDTGIRLMDNGLLIYDGGQQLLAA